MGIFWSSERPANASARLVGLICLRRSRTLTWAGGAGRAGRAGAAGGGSVAADARAGSSAANRGRAGESSLGIGGGGLYRIGEGSVRIAVSIGGSPVPLPESLDRGKVVGA